MSHKGGGEGDSHFVTQVLGHRSMTEGKGGRDKNRNLD